MEGIAERVLADWPKDVQPVLREAIKQKCIEAMKLYSSAAAEPEAKTCTCNDPPPCPMHAGKPMCSRCYNKRRIEWWTGKISTLIPCPDCTACKACGHANAHRVAADNKCVPFGCEEPGCNCEDRR